MPAGIQLPSYVTFVLEHFHNVQETRDGWLASCPCSNHGRGQGDNSPSVRITVGEEGRLLISCRTGCPTTEVLTAADLRFIDLFPSGDEPPMEQLCREVEAEPREEDIALRDRVYSFLLERLVLSDSDRALLSERGLSAAAIDAGRYRSMRIRNQGILRRLHDEFGDELFNVPGFKPEGQGAVFVTSGEGILIPVCNYLGQVVALKIRRHRVRENEPRYFYLSGGEVSSGSPYHFPLGAGFTREVRVTEGELKAAVATDRTGLYTISIPGVSQWRRLLPLLQQLDIGRVVVAFDWPDVVQNNSVFRQWDGFISQLQECGFQVAIEEWPINIESNEPKGIDDALLAETPIEVCEGDSLNQRIADLRSRHGYIPSAVTSAPVEPPPAPTSSGVPAFPVEVFPASLQEFIRRTAESKQCPVDFPGVAALVVAGAMIGSSHAIRVIDDWEEKPALYAVIVAPPGSRKTPALKACMNPVYGRQAEFAREFEQAEATADTPEARREVKPMRHLFANDTTVEALASILHANRRGVLLFRDELTAWVRGMDQYKGGKGTDRQFFLTCWSGESTKVDRKSSLNKPIHIEHPFVSVLGGIQPDLLSELEDKHGREDGFLHRILFSFPPPFYPSTPVSVGLPAELRARWATVVQRLIDLPTDPQNHAPRVLDMSPAAHAAWYDWATRHMAEVQSSELPEILKGPWAKFEAYFVRFALILRMLRWATDDIVSEEQVDLEDIRNAELVVNYFKAHARAVYDKLKAKLEDPLVDRLIRLAHQQGGEVRCRQARAYLNLKTNSETIKVFKRAVDLGFGTACKVKHKKKNEYTDMFRLNAPEEEGNE